MEEQTLMLDAMPIEQLLHLKERVEQEIQKRHAAELEAFREKAKQMSAQLGLSLLELLGAATEKKAARVALPPKYRDPQSGETWSGKGPTPKWIRESGKTKEHFLISHA